MTMDGKCMECLDRLFDTFQVNKYFNFKLEMLS